jgi:predicted acyl esterase
MALNGEGLSETAGDETAIEISSPETIGTSTLIWGNNGDGSPEEPVDQRPDDALSLTFDSAPLDQPLEILGAPVAELELAADQANAFVAVRLSEVLPDGASALVSYGLLS